MKSNEIIAADLLPFGRYDLGQRTSAAPSARTTQGRPAASAATPQVGPLQDQPPEVQKTAAARHAALAAARHTATPAKRRPAARTTQRRHTPAAPKGRTTQGHPASSKTRHMMLMNDLYTIDHLETGTATLRLNAEHPIFKGHFPGKPVLPGACQLQMIRELLSHIAAKPYRLQKAAAIKFITPIDPRHNPTIRLDLQYDEVQNAILRVTASIQAGEATCLKFNGTFQTG